MKRQKYVKSLKKGSKLYRVHHGVNIGGRRFADVDEYKVTSIQYRKNGAFAIKHLPDYATEKTVFINSDCGGISYNFKVGDDLPAGVYTTKLKALQYAVKDVEDSIQWYKGELETDAVKNDPEELAIYVEELEDMKVILRMIKGKITKEKKARG